VNEADVVHGQGSVLLRAELEASTSKPLATMH